jgi:GT2 family glycosyltransferase
VLDEDLVMYCEDVDLNIRARLRGIRTIYVPRAIVYHRLSATGGGSLASYYCGRNFILVWAKNMPGTLAWRFWPALLHAQIGYTLESFWHIREAAARARLRGQIDSLWALPRFLRKRAHRFPTAAAPRLAAALYREHAYSAAERTEYTAI